VTLRDILNFIYTFTLQTSSSGILGNPGLSPARSGDDELKEFVHQAHMSLFTKIANSSDRYFYKTATVNETAGVSQYDLPSDCYRVLRIERVVGGTSPLPYVLRVFQGNAPELETLRGTWPVSTVAPQGVESYFQHGLKWFELVRASTATVTGAFKVCYTARPARMTADNHVPFQSPAAVAPATAYDNLDEWHDIIAWRALESAMMKDEDTSSARVMQRCREREYELERFLSRANAQRPRFVNYTRFGDC
jgi:hypothetical protein